MKYEVEKRFPEWFKIESACFSDTTIPDDLALELAGHALFSRPIMLRSEFPGSGHGIIARRIAGFLMGPLRAPHHTVSLPGMIGRVDKYGERKPGEVQLARRGVLLIEDVTEFRPNILSSSLDAMLASGAMIVLSTVTRDSDIYRQQIDKIKEMFDPVVVDVSFPTYAEMREKKTCSWTNAKLREHLGLS
jgi:hypothetical protein